MPEVQQAAVQQEEKLSCLRGAGGLVRVADDDTMLAVGELIPLTKFAKRSRVFQGAHAHTSSRPRLCSFALCFLAMADQLRIVIDVSSQLLAQLESLWHMFPQDEVVQEAMQLLREDIEAAKQVDPIDADAVTDLRARMNKHRQALLASMS